MNNNKSMSEFMALMAEYGDNLTCPKCDRYLFGVYVKPKIGFSFTCHACGHIDKESFKDYEKVFWEWVK